MEGQLQTRDYTDRDGNRRYATEVVADNVYFGDSRRDSEGSGGAPSPEGAMALRLTAAPPVSGGGYPLTSPHGGSSSLTSPTTTVSCPSEPLSSRGPSDHF